jgi:hypothetical protein
MGRRKIEIEPITVSRPGPGVVLRASAVASGVAGVGGAAPCRGRDDEG